MILVSTSLAGCSVLTRTEYLLPPIQYEQDCEGYLVSTRIEDQLEGMRTVIRCERANNAAQREYRARVLSDD
jgi:hypothetical protein